MAGVPDFQGVDALNAPDIKTRRDETGLEGTWPMPKAEGACHGSWLMADAARRFKLEQNHQRQYHQDPSSTQVDGAGPREHTSNMVLVSS
ncbi:hypothetical protein VCV18_009822 [Metarhizium anisopliae]